MAALYFPDLETFCRKAKEGPLAIPVFRELSADLDTPVSVFLKLKGRTPGFLLESAEGGERLGRYSFLGVGYSLMLKASGTKVTIYRNGKSKELTLKDNQDPLHLVKSRLSQYRTLKMPGFPPFSGGAVGYLSYDMVRFFEKLPQPSQDELGLPDCIFIFTDTVLAFDHVQHKIKIIATSYPDKEPERAYYGSVAKIEEIVASLTKPLPAELITSFAFSSEHNGTEPRSNFTKEEFSGMVEVCQEYIASGEAIQIVPSQRLRRKAEVDSFTIYRTLRMLNPSPYMFFLDFGDFQLIGSSPEMLAKLEGDRVTMHPIAGTRPRGENEDEDEALITELLADQKERAEHVMLVDLARNDMGRVCQYGTVKVPELMRVEKYSHVSHIVSTVEGKLRPDQDAFSLLRAVFPAGTVSGAPKIRAMEIITELEKTKRGPYAGAVGYFDFGGNMDTCITIRTIVMTGNIAYLQGGAGIVADSKPANEYEETLNKVKVLEKAISMAEGAGVR